MNNKRTFREIKDKVEEITNRPPSEEQVEDLKNVFTEIEENLDVGSPEFLRQT